MRRTTAGFALFLLLSLTLSITTPAAGQQPPPPPTPPSQPQPAPDQPPLPPTREIIPGRSIAGIVIGSAESAVLRRFGRPAEIRATAVDTFYNFSRIGMGVYTKDGRVTAVSTTNSLMSMDRQLGVGYRRDDTVRILGAQFREGVVEGFRGPVYDARGIAFGLDGTTIAVVLVFRPGTAANVSGLQPATGIAVQPPRSGFPNVAGLRPFTAESNYMSLPGYLRWLVFQTSGQWITYTEAARIVREQQGL